MEFPWVRAAAAMYYVTGGTFFSFSKDIGVYSDGKKGPPGSWAL